MLYKQLPFTGLTMLLVAAMFGFAVWDRDKPFPLMIWLFLLCLVTAIRYFSAQQFKRKVLDETNIRKWENYYLAGIAASALIWGSTGLWLREDSPASQQVFQIFMVTGLTIVSVAGLAFRPLAFQLFLVLILLPYFIRFIFIGSPFFLASAALTGVYTILMLLISMRVYRIINEALQLRYQNVEQAETRKDAGEYNTNATEIPSGIRQKRRDKDLEKSETFLRSIFITANDGIITTDATGIILAINHAIERDFGYTEKEMLGNNIKIIMADDMGPKHDQYMEHYLKSKAPVLTGRMLDVMGKRKDGSMFPMEITVSEARVDDKIYFTGIIRDISERKEYEKAMNDMMKELAQAKLDLEKANSQLQDRNKALTRLSELDALTGLANRRFLMNAFGQEWFRHQRNNRPISVILLDIDFFKRFNDSYGHQAGDECLKRIAVVLKQNIARPGDFIARYGGEEFIAVLPETEPEGAWHLAEKMRRAVEKLQIIHNGSNIAGHVTISGGVASIIPNANNNCELLIKWADEALYEAKHSGRNCIRQHANPVAATTTEKQ